MSLDASKELATFGNYRLLRRLADGGMASIYLASITGPDGFSKQCVLKKIRPQYSDSTEFRQMLVQEARIAAILSHPNIVQVFDFGRVENEYFLTMEWVDGVALSVLMQRAARRGAGLGLRPALLVGTAMAEALEYIHFGVRVDGAAVNLVHRDVTPSNILVSRSGATKLTDFGIVKVLEAPSSTRVGVIKGKYAYMSPEQLKAEKIDHRSDLFSLGVVLYEMITGRRLFRRREVAATVAAVLTGKVPPPSTIAPEVPPELDRIVLKLLAKDRDQRYWCAQDLVDDLTELARDEAWSPSPRELAQPVEDAQQSRAVRALEGQAEVVPLRPSSAPPPEERDVDLVFGAPADETGPMRGAPPTSDATATNVGRHPSLQSVAPTARPFQQASPPWPTFLGVILISAAIAGSIAFWLILLR
ncbi:MAG: protein kinase [Deltaproteobacteria bacterium]|nr:protein kinase [Deltaproteobacteria bacterium]